MPLNMLRNAFVFMIIIIPHRLPNSAYVLFLVLVFFIVVEKDGELLNVIAFIPCIKRFAIRKSYKYSYFVLKDFNIGCPKKCTTILHFVVLHACTAVALGHVSDFYTG